MRKMPFSVSVIDFHGLLDETIPYDLNSPPGNWQEGPYETIISKSYLYYDQGLFVKSDAVILLVL